MNTTTNSGTTPNRDQLDQMCARFTTLRGADAEAWLAAGDRLAAALQSLGGRLAQLRVARRAERRNADGLAYGL